MFFEIGILKRKIEIIHLREINELLQKEGIR